MPLSRERVVWIAIPAGTPTHPRHLSVVVAPRIEGTGRIPLSDLPRLSQWTKYVQDLLAGGLLEVRVNGAAVEHEVVDDPKLSLDPALWPKLFEPTLDVDLVNLVEELDQAGRHESRTPVVSPTVQGTHVFKGIYRERVAQQAGAPGEGAQPFFQALEIQAAEPEVQSWQGYISALGDQVITTSTVPPQELEFQAQRLMSFQETFHGRPPLRVFPDLVRDERELGDRNRFRAFAVSDAPLSLTAGVDPAATLPRLTEARPTRIGARAGVQAFAEGISPTTLVAAAPGDRIVGDGCAFRLRPGDEIELTPTENQWECGEVVVQVQPEDDDAVLYARHLYPCTALPKRIVFRLPDSPPEGFKVTLRSLEPQTVLVVGTGLTGKSTELIAGEGQIYRWTGSQFESEAEEREELHRRLASLRSYPALLRRLGLVIDLKLRTGIAEAGHVRVVPLAGNAMQDICPCTLYKISTAAGLFQSLRRPSSILLDGFLSNSGDRSRFKLVQLDAETAALKNLQQARSRRLYEEIPERNVVKLDARGRPDEGGDLASLRQIGIALCDTQAKDETKAALARAAEVIQALCPGGGEGCPELAGFPEMPVEGRCVLFAEDLLVGFRVDVRHRQGSGTISRWRSLCRRHGEYELGPGYPEPWPYNDEGFLSPSADEVRDPQSEVSGVRVSEALFRWDGWSLVTSRPGEVVSETDGAVTQRPDNVNRAAPVRATFTPQPGSLERLRLGSRYDFRLRAVDLAGNSLSVDDADTLLQHVPVDDPRIFYSGCYERLEPVVPPVLVPTEMPGLGESSDQLVIRSDGREADSREWLLLPPGASPSFVELHGELDDYAPGASYRMLAAHDGEAPAWDLEQRGYREDWLREHWNHFTGELRLPYLPDPMAHSALFRQKDANGKVWALAELKLARNGKGRYPDRLRARVLRLASGSTPRVGDSGHTLQFSLPPGRMAKVEVATCPPEEELHRFGLLNWCRCPDEQGRPCDEVEPAGGVRNLSDAALHQACCAGEIGLITPSKELTLVHAVEKPLIPVGRKSLGIVTEQTFRFENPVQVTLGECVTDSGSSTNCVFGLVGTAWIDRPSTGKLDIRLEWTEPLDIPELPEVLLRPHALQPFQMPVPLDLADFVLLPSHPSAKTCANVAPTSNARPCAVRDSFEFRGNVRFEDGKHRKVALSFDATSRFVSFFQDPNAKPAEGEPAQRDPTGRFRRPSDAATVHFPARVPPPLPSPLYMVPTFRTSEEKDGKTRRFHRQGGLRIFLERDWFASGEDEMLAVVFAPTRSTVLSPPLDQLVSAWGADPFWESPDMDSGKAYERTTSRLPELRERPLLEDVQNPERKESSVITPLRFAPPAEDDGAGNMVEPAEVELAIAAYTPQLDDQKNLWYVDVDIKAPTYFPFLRLGLARYQRYAQTGCELSGIVPATFCQLVPDVTVSVVPVRKKCYEITVIAPASFSAPRGTNFIDRTFEAIVIRTDSSSKNIAYAVQDSEPAIQLTLDEGPIDSEAKWRGVVPVDRLKCGWRMVVVERQGWGQLSTNQRVVGCVA